MKPEHSIHVFINKTKYELPDPVQTGRSLKELAGIPLGDALFLQRPGDDEVVTNDTKVTLKNGDHLHSQPAADYGFGPEQIREAGISPEKATLHPQSDGWNFLVVSDFELPDFFQPHIVRLLLKLPPLFPDAAPDMFWVSPSVRTKAGSLPRATTHENLLGEDWQRFSWHLAPGAWKVGVSTLRDFFRCIKARLLRQD